MSMFKRPCHGPLTSYYGRRVHPVTGERGKMHFGLDYGTTPSDNRIFSVGNGYVKMAQYMNGYGNMIVTRHLVNGVYYDVVYAHLASFKVRVGQQVKAGQTIAIKGNTGVGTGVHLHLEIHVNTWTGNMANTRNPALYIYDKGVHEEQARLASLGIAVQADGYYGKGTENAVMVFQRREGLTADGFLGFNTRNRLFAKTPNFNFASYLEQQKPIEKEKEKEVKEDMAQPFNAGTATLNASAKRFIEEAVADGILTDSGWITKFEEGKITGQQMLGLSIHIQQQRNQLFAPRTTTLKESVKQLIENGLEEGVLHDDSWLKKYENGELSTDDVLSLKLLIDERRLKAKK